MEHGGERAKGWRTRGLWGRCAVVGVAAEAKGCGAVHVRDGVVFALAAEAGGASQVQANENTPGFEVSLCNFSWGVSFWHMLRGAVDGCLQNQRSRGST